MQNYQEMMKSTFDNITQIGAGGGGAIYKAYHKRLGIEVVLKKIHTNKLNTISHEAEKDILKGLKNDYIPKIYDFIEYGEDVFTVMEYIPGESFAQLLAKNKKFSQKDVAKWLLQLCKVVDYLHSQKPAIIHCDIKPGNIMLTPEGNICLIDFNISGVKTDEGIAAIGYTNGYAPVEQFSVVAGYLEKKAAEKATASVVSVVERQVIRAEDADDDSTEVPDDDSTEVADDDSTEVPDDDSTEVADDDSTEVSDNDSTEAADVHHTEAAVTYRKSEHSRMKALNDEEWKLAKDIVASVGRKLMVDERTDIYSVGASMYHILTGVKPQPFYREQIPVLAVNPNISESLAYVIDKAMALKPEDRFRDSEQMLKTVRNIGTVDKRYKALVRKQWIFFLTMMGLTVASAGTLALGRTTMANEKETQYREYVAEMSDADERSDYVAVEQIYKDAVALFPEKQDAYYQMAAVYYEAREYEKCIVFLNDDVYVNVSVSQENGYDRFYYLTASCYFEREDYDTAIDYYKMALNYQENEISYYRDYVIALARSGQLDAAEQVLQVATEKGISGDIISLLDGEIALMKDKYVEAEKYLKECISSTTDDYTRLRAYTKLDEVYEILYSGAEQYTIRITYLKEALAGLPSQYQVTLMERLAQAYIDFSDVQDKNENCRNAIEVFGEMEKLGYATFTSRYNIAVLYEKMGNYDEAMTCLEDMLELYENNYNIYKRMAFVELNIQAKKSNTSRDYHVFKEYYDKAATLYQENAKGDDVEMLSLQQLYNDVVSNGWL